MRKILTTAIVLATALTFNLATAQKVSALESGPSMSPKETSMTSFGTGKEVRQQAANDAVVFLADGQVSDLLNNILAEIRVSNPELAILSDIQISKEIIKAAIANP